MTPEQGQLLYQLILENDIHDIMELGFFHGVSTVYMAGALDEKSSKGLITTFDKLQSKALDPSLETLSSNLHLEQYINPVYAESCYTWELSKLLSGEDTENYQRPQYDLIFIDGAHLWKTDALAFFLCDKMLKEGGYLIFDDLKWSMAKNADRNSNEWTKKYSQEEQDARQIQLVFDLLVKEHPGYGDFREEDGWGFARKVKADQRNELKESTIVKSVVVSREMLRNQMSKAKN